MQLTIVFYKSSRQEHWDYQIRQKYRSQGIAETIYEIYLRLKLV